MKLQFTKATKTQARLRLAYVGPAGAGKTYSALAVATNLGGRVAVIDTEHGSASKYAGLFEFDTLQLESFEPETYTAAIAAAEAAGYDVLVIDSLSHAWMGKGGALEQVDNAARRSQSKNSYTAWRDVTPKHNGMVDAIVRSKCHVIATMRAESEYVIEKDDRGKSVPRKIGLAPIQRDGVEFEFDVVGDLDTDNNFIVSKTRCPALAGAVINKPGANLAATLQAWLTDGARAPVPTPQAASERTENRPEPRVRTGAQAQPPASNGANGHDLISEPQRKRFWAIIGELKLTNDEAKGVLAKLGIVNEHGMPSSNLIPKSKYEEVERKLRELGGFKAAASLAEQGTLPMDAAPEPGEDDGYTQSLVNGGAP